MMRWLYTVRGTHTHIKCYVNGALCGTLIFRNDEFAAIVEKCGRNEFALIEFVKEGE